MEGTSFIVIAGFLLLYGLVSRRLEATIVTPPMVFVVFGLVIGPEALGLVHLEISDAGVHLLAELTLALVLFGDAARIDLRALRRELGLPVRLLAIGPLVGIGFGWAGGWLVQRAIAREWMNESYHQLSGVALALLCFAGAEALGGSGFIAAFVGGLTLGNTRRSFCAPMYAFLEAEGQLLMLLVFMVLGSTLAWPALTAGSWKFPLYAVLSLTVARMIPVALSMIGTRARPATVAFVGWFGPRGLASVLFGLVLLEQAQIPHREVIFTAVMVTVLCSVFAHGLTAVPGARWYGRLMEGHHADACEMQTVTEHPLRTRGRSQRRAHSLRGG